ncbi:hypothetical protein C922_05317 [Plasmodium inui San Antonio 1]|uniref:Uncharacterized protein n=1 Tax=Plasmodium inui San Antonio 1 TaxID=1237626 RepID=W6ZTR4_9APIC|nr:hypothetical protein C922_05317 [Plasmodium inui San Antonio 1]EUD64302.1 hypothetical protein C922_05317 [Plasmodium inui San Antonio 1]
MSNLRISSASGRNVNFQGCNHSNDGSVSTWDADCSDIKSGGTVKNSFKILFRSSVFTVLLLAVHCSTSNGPYSQWKGEATNEMKVPRYGRMLYNSSASYKSNDHSPSTQTIPASSSSSPPPFSPFSIPSNSFSTMNNPTRRNNDVWSTYEDGLRYLNHRAFRNMGNDFRYPNFFQNSFNGRSNFMNLLYSKFNENGIFYLFSFILGLFLLNQLGSEKLFMLAAAVGVMHHLKRSTKSR